MPDPVVDNQSNAFKTAMSDFLSPKPVVGAGACSAMVLALTTSLCSAFPMLPGAIVALMISGLFSALMVTINNGQKPIVKILYGLICTLMIFSAARGGNVTVKETITPPEKNVPENTIQVGESLSFIPCAYAGDTNTASRTFHFAYMTNGLPVYTNTTGQFHTNMNFKSQSPKLFRDWKWE